MGAGRVLSALLAMGAAVGGFGLVVGCVVLVAVGAFIVCAVGAAALLVGVVTGLALLGEAALVGDGFASAGFLGTAVARCCCALNTCKQEPQRTAPLAD